MEQTFSAKMTNSVKGITFVFYLIVFSVPFTTLLIPGAADAIIIPIVVVLLSLLTYFLRPFEYLISGQQLIIRKNILPRKIDLTDIASVEAIDYSALKLGLRLFGSGGVWGWFGYFWTSNMGIVLMQCSEKDNLVLIKTLNNKKIIISPAERDIFLRSLNEHLPVKMQSAH